MLRVFIAILLIGFCAVFAVTTCVSLSHQLPPPTDAEILDSFDRLISDLEEKNRNVPIELWPELDRKFMQNYQTGRQEILLKRE